MNSDFEMKEEEILKDSYSCDDESYNEESFEIASGITFSEYNDEFSQTYLVLIKSLIEGDSSIIENLNKSDLRDCIFI